MTASQNDKVEILPDPTFMTQNTADLKAMLESLNKKGIPNEQEVFNLDFKEVLDSTPKEESPNNMKSFQCNQCNFRGATARCLNAHTIFLHDSKSFKCNICKITTRTEQAMFYHMNMKHSEVYLQMRKTASDSLQQYRERSGNPNNNHVKETTASS